MQRCTVNESLLHGPNQSSGIWLTKWSQLQMAQQQLQQQLRTHKHSRICISWHSKHRSQSGLTCLLTWTGATNWAGLHMQ